MTEQEKQTRRARRAQERAAAGPIPNPEGPEGEAPEAPQPAEASPEAIKDRNKRLRDQAARKRAKRRQERSAAAVEGLDAGERFDDALTRGAHATTKFIQRNIGWLQWVIVFGAAGSIGYLIYEHRSELAKEKASDALMTAVAAQQGNVAGGAEWRSPDSNLVDPRQEFASNEERLKAAEERYRSALGEPSNPGTRLYAHLGLAGVLFDQGRYADARAEYENAKNSPLAASMADAKGRALEGLALSFEAEGNLERALAALAELEKVDGYGETARYQKARLWHAQGESQKALEELKKLQEGFPKNAPGERPSFLQLSVSELIRTIDPDATPPDTGAQGITPEQLQELQRQFEEMQRQQGQVPQNLPLETSLPLGPAPTGAPEPPSDPAPAEGQGASPAPKPAPTPPAPKPPAPKPTTAPQQTKPPAPPAPTSAAPKPTAPAPQQAPPQTAPQPPSAAPEPPAPAPTPEAP